MKKQYQLLVVILCALPFSVRSQEVNWRTINENTNHLVSAYFGADYSSYYGLSYGYVIQTKRTPIVIGTELTVPFGEEVMDDWRWRASAQAEIWKRNSLSVTIKPSFIVRRYESPLARLYNVGTDLTLQYGLVKPKWSLVAITSYDMSIATHIKHDLLKEYYVEIRDGWYGASGGNFKFGARVGAAIGTMNTFLTVGKHFGQDFQDNPTLPFFAEFSIQKALSN